MTEAEVIELLRSVIKAKYRTAANFCVVTEIDPGYLSKVLKGKLRPSPPILRALGLKRIIEVSYGPIQAWPCAGQ